MRHHLSIIAAIWRKDLALHWPIVAVTALLLLQPALLLAPGLRIPPLLATVQIAAMYLACALVIVAVIQQDALPGVRHDWLTKPIPRADLFIAKAALLIPVLLIPMMCTDAAIHLSHGRSLAETLLAVFSIQRVSLAIAFLAIAAVASITSTLVEATLAVVASLLVISLLIALSTALSDTGEEVFFLGSGWVLLQPIGLVALASTAIVLWLQFRHRNTTASRIILAASMILLALSPAAFSWRFMFDVQQKVSERPRAAAGVRLGLTRGCFPAAPIDPTLPGVGRYDGIDPELVIAPTRLRATVWSEWQREAAGKDAIAFATSATFAGINDGALIRVGRVQGGYIDGQDQVRYRLVPSMFTPVWRQQSDGGKTAGHLWLLSREAAEELASDQSIRLQLEYSLSLLEPIATVSFDIGDERRYTPGMGHCGAQRDSATGRVSIDCFKVGTQPALFAAEIEGLTNSSTTTTPDYTPAWLEFFGGQRHRLDIPRINLSADARIKVTAYRDVAHFVRQVVVPGVLGGPPADCPAPPSSS